MYQQIPNTVYPGKSYPLGATVTNGGVNFAIYSENASLVVLCLFDKNNKEVNRINMRWNEEGVWHCFLPNARPGLRYGYRIHGEFAPHRGLYFNPSKLLLDPYAKDVCGEIEPRDEIYGYQKNSLFNKNNFYSRDTRDSAPYNMKAVVVDEDDFDWEDDRPLKIPMRDTIIYEIHVKGFSKLNSKIPENLRGTYLGLSHPESIKYLKELGVTSIELLPIHLSMNESRLTSMGLTNYWGYNSIGFFCPDPRFSSNRCNAVKEFKQMVKELHKAGLEVILDVVYNHTAEQGHDGPQLSFRGLDNPTYYKLSPENEYCNFTGCGNSFDTRNNQTLRLIADSLRYWVEKMHVDGFRFDLASTLARIGSTNNYSKNANFFSVLMQDPILCQTKLIAEPWDCGPNGYQVGGFPKGWSEWNGDWRDTIRKFWKGEANLLGKFACKFSGSSDLYWNRGPLASINFVTAHDGFTLNDLVTYEHKYNFKNGEDNRDGSNDNHSWNCGCEGETSSVSINNLRERQMRNMLLTLFLSQGVPMLLGGDEIARTQRGNNNAYCQDNFISYFDWNLNDRQRLLFKFTSELINLRKSHLIFRRYTFFNGQIDQSSLKDIIWLNDKGLEMQGADWDRHCGHFGIYIDGSCIDATTDQGEHLQDECFLFIVNNESKYIEFKLTNQKNYSSEWHVVIDTYNYPNRPKVYSSLYTLPPHSAALFVEKPRKS
ncbi:glycogen debranching protein GlgX [bacterium]|nr:glycogen debranching protein GlgX [bacterium]